MQKRRSKPYIWVPVFLAVYAVAMALFNLDNLKTPSGQKTFWITLAVEAVLIILVAFFLKRRTVLREKRDNLRKNTQDIIEGK